ncbi:alpha/beta fold hydrolase [Plantactinospora soyae]|uniref:Pimeloyl-ACP methyl ester carboxylesterase n=1 Tax=Plantactinospora soyae TaxID=1544732 RepID=A0A927R9C2_9ACTN|nr:alpha/beta fold hydrolase [Plantactinospora soyae]MBE1489646.1 pimeloyl-ACP methyl ester carboxylesterase [Plantactinospora soyae]
MSTEPSAYLLVPGAWHGGWSWWPVAKRLRAAGHRAVTVTLPGLADGDDRAGLRFQDAVDHLVSEVERRALTDVTLVGHSWAGYPIAAAVHRLAGRVSRLVYYNAQVPMPGRSMADDNPPEVAAFLRGLIESSPDRAIPPTLEFVQQIFMQDVAEDAQRLLAELLVPHPGAYFLDALDVPDVTTLGIPTRYLLGEHDHALPRPGAEFAARLGVEPVLVPGTHEGLLTHPDAVADAILAA